MNKPHLFEQRANRSRPHSSLAHFRCVVAHELRVYQAMYQEEGQAEDPDVFLTGLSEAIGRVVEYHISEGGDPAEDFGRCEVGFDLLEGHRPSTTSP